MSDKDGQEKECPKWYLRALFFLSKAMYLMNAKIHVLTNYGIAALITFSFASHIEIMKEVYAFYRKRWIQFVAIA